MGNRTGTRTGMGTYNYLRESLQFSSAYYMPGGITTTAVQRSVQFIHVAGMVESHDLE